jgi:hypothetical protein
MASSRLTEDGRVIVTTPATWCDVGHELYVLGSGATYGIRPSDWVLRLVAGSHSTGRPWGEGVDVRPAYEALLEALANGSVHASLIEEPREAA